MGIGEHVQLKKGSHSLRAWIQMLLIILSIIVIKPFRLYYVSMHACIPCMVELNSSYDPFVA